MKLHWILSISPFPFSMLSMQDFPVDFAAMTTLKWGGGDVREWTKKNEIDAVSQLFLHGIVDAIFFFVARRPTIFTEK